MTSPAWNTLRSGNVNKDIARIGNPVPSARKVNTRQYRFAFSQLNTNVLSLANYVLIEQPGFAFGLNNASDTGAVAIVHVNVPGNPVYITPGTPKPIPEGFQRLYLERPTQPPVPARADLFYIFDTSDRADGIVYGPMDPARVNGGANAYNAPALVAVTVLPNAVTPPQLILAALSGRRIANFTNASPGAETIYLTLDVASTNQDFNTAGIVAVLGPGQTFSLPYTGAIAAFASAATAKLYYFELS